MTPPHPSRPDFEVRRYDDAVVQRLIAELQAEYVVRYGGPDAAVVDPREFDPPRGLFLLARLDGGPVAMGGFRALPELPGAVELKRMYVVAGHRRRGLARVLLAELEQRARAAGAARILLNTGLEQPEAVALYEAEGYEKVPGFGHYAGAPLALFYGKPLR